MLTRIHQYQLSAIAAIALLAALAVAGCGQEEVAVCPPRSEHIVLVPSTSETDYDVSLEMTPEVSRQVVRRVAASCGRITVGIQDGRPGANLELQSKRLTSKEQGEKAYNPGAKTDELVEDGDEFVQASLIDPLGETEPTGGSPFLTTMVKVGEEIDAQGWDQGTVVLVGDGLVVERPPGDGKAISFGTEPVSAADLAPYVPLLKSLRGSCVVLIGAGATSKLSADSIRASHQLLGETLEKAGVDFVATRSPELPARC
jgi:hypothetical protein